ncbi:hypothetical protein EMCRGX_G013976 [Ephydatia muelleri]
MGRRPTSAGWGGDPPVLYGEETHQCWGDPPGCMGRRPTSAYGEENHQCWMGRSPTSAEWGGGPPVLYGEENPQCWMGRRPPSAGWGGDLPVLDGEESHQCWMGMRHTSAGWGGDPPVLEGEETHQCWRGRRPTSVGGGGDPPVLDGEETHQCWMGRRPTSAGWGGDLHLACVDPALCTGHFPGMAVVLVAYYRRCCLVPRPVSSAVGGAAVYAINSYGPSFFIDSNFLTLDTAPFGHLILQGVMIKDNLCSCNDYNELSGGAIYFNGMKVDIIGNTFSGSQFSSNSPLGAIQGTNGFLQLHGSITFRITQE